jgi:GH24 family phage-related lysozyme (muramidase)
MSINYNTLNSQAYDDELLNALAALEGNIQTPYKDSKGIVTIGIGVNLSISRNRSSMLSSLGVGSVATDPRRAALDAYLSVAQTGKSNAQIQSDLNAIMNSQGFSGQTFSFSTSGASQAASLLIILQYDADLTQSLAYRPPYLPVAVPESRERVALLSLFYNAESLIGPSLVDALRSGDRAAVWFEIRYRSNKERYTADGPGVARRRYVESEVFGLYKDPQNATLEEAQAAYAIVSAHRAQIASYETQFGADPDGASPTALTGQLTNQYELSTAVNRY